MHRKNYSKFISIDVLILLTNLPHTKCQSTFLAILFTFITCLLNLEMAPPLVLDYIPSHERVKLPRYWEGAS